MLHPHLPPTSLLAVSPSPLQTSLPLLVLQHSDFYGSVHGPGLILFTFPWTISIIPGQQEPDLSPKLQPIHPSSLLVPKIGYPMGHANSI